MRRPHTLFTKTGSTLTLAMLVFLALSVAVVFHYILVPVSKRAADDLAKLMLLATKTWVELPPETRPEYEYEMLEQFNLKIRRAEDSLPYTKDLLPYLHFLEESLTHRVGEPIPILTGSCRFASRSAFHREISVSMAWAHCSASVASCGPDFGVPKFAITASPIYLSIVPA